MIKHLLPFLLCLVFRIYLCAQDVAVESPSQPSQVAPDAEELTRLLQQFLERASRNEVAVHDRFWADDLIYTSSSERRIGKADIMREVCAESGKAA